MTKNLNTLEERIEKPGYLLFVVLILLLLIIGFVNLIDFTSFTPVVFGRYSIPYVGVLVAYFIGILVWVSLLLKPNDDRLFKKALDIIQKRPIIAIGIFLVYGVIIYSMYTKKQWLNLPALQVSLIGIMLLTGGAILFYRWGDKSLPQLWRKFIVYPVATLLGIELVMQALAFVGLLPNISQLTDPFAPYTRVYYTEEGFENASVNNYGWHYPRFQLLPDSHRILIFGDSFIKALQVDAEDNLGVALEQYLNADGEQPIEVLALGNPDYGPGLYLDPLMMQFAIDKFKPDEVIVFFDMGNDFQVDQSADDSEYLYFIEDEAGEVVIHPDDWLDHHLTQHNVTYNYEGFQLVRYISSHNLTVRLAKTLLNTPAVNAETAVSTPDTDIKLTNGFVFNAESNAEAMTIATGLIKIGFDFLADAGVEMRLVTIPVFSDEFLAQDAWNTKFGESNLLLPEQELRDFAAENDIPFLGLGAYMGATGTTPADVQSLYFNNGRGHFTPEGHDFAATAVYECFFADALSSDEGCDLR